MRKIKKLFKFVFYLILLCVIVIAVGVYFPGPKLPDAGYEDNVYIRNVNVVDTVSGQIVRAQNILVRDGVIENISAEDIRPKDELLIIVDGDGKYAIPGLWDMHHASTKRSPYIDHPLLLANGVTHVRDLSGCLNQKDSYWACVTDIKRWKRSEEQGKQYSPYYHQYTALEFNGGAKLPQDYSRHLHGSNLSQVKDIVNFAKYEELDFITIGADLRADIYASLASEISNSDMFLAGEKPLRISLQDSLRLGQKSYDQASLFAQECSGEIRDLRTLSSAEYLLKNQQRQKMLDSQNSILCKALMTEMASTGAWWTPSLYQLKGQALLNDFAFKRNGNLKYIPLVTRYLHWHLQLKNSPFTQETSSRNYQREFFELVKNQTAEANDAGIRIMVGTNAAAPYNYSGFGVHDEISELANAGLSPLQALRSASQQPAIFNFESRNFGSIRTNMQADFILLNANPLENINNTKDIYAVITRARYYDRESLDALLLYAEKQAKNWHLNIKLFWDAIASPLMRKEYLSALKSSD